MLIDRHNIVINLAIWFLKNSNVHVSQNVGLFLKEKTNIMYKTKLQVKLKHQFPDVLIPLEFYTVIMAGTPSLWWCGRIRTKFLDKLEIFAFFDMKNLNNEISAWGSFSLKVPVLVWYWLLFSFFLFFYQYQSKPKCLDQQTVSDMGRSWQQPIRKQLDGLSPFQSLTSVR